MYPVEFLIFRFVQVPSVNLPDISCRATLLHFPPAFPCIFPSSACGKCCMAEPTRRGHGAVSSDPSSLSTTWPDGGGCRLPKHADVQNHKSPLEKMRHLMWSGGRLQRWVLGDDENPSLSMPNNKALHALPRKRHWWHTGDIQWRDVALFNNFHPLSRWLLRSLISSEGHRLGQLARCLWSNRPVQCGECNYSTLAIW